MSVLEDSVQIRVGEQSSLRVPCTRKKEEEERLSNLFEYVEWKLKKNKHEIYQ